MNLKFLLMLMLLASTCLPQARAATTWVTIAEGDVNIIMPFTPTELFSAPTNVRLSPTDTWQTLSWDDVEHASKFEVQALNTEGNWETIIVTEELFLEITDDYADYTSFRVVACNYASCEGTGDWSAASILSVVDIQNVDIEEKTFDVYWGEINPSQTVELFEEKDGTAWQEISVTAGSSYHSLTRTNGLYRYKVKFCNDEACSAEKISATITINDLANSDSINNTLDLAALSDNMVGTTAAQFRVSESGAATYQVPLSLPAGVAGVTPQVALSYNSQAGEGLLGQGWSLSAGGGISRCPKNIFHNGDISGVNYDDTDIFCLDGQQLVVNSGTYGEAGSTYHTVIDNFAEITAHGQATDSGPEYFTVATKAGDTYYYGQTDDTEDTGDAFVEPNNPDGGNDLAKFWALKKVVDIAGNSIVYHYDEDSVAGSHYLASITYGGNVNEGTMAFNTVTFNYDDNLKPRAGFSGGSTFLADQLLTSINITNNGDDYRFYNLDYFTSVIIEEHNYLETITECLTEGDGTGASCLNPLTFTWNRPDPLITTTEDKEYCTQYRDGHEECETHQVPTSENFSPFDTATPLTTTSAGYQFSHIFDINGDGYADIISEYDGLNEGWYASFGPKYDHIQHMSNVGSSEDRRAHALTIDYNGDGIMDMLVADDTGNWHVLTYAPYVVESDFCVGSGDNCTPVVTHYTYQTVDLGIPAIDKDNVQIMDVDGDGLQDIVFGGNNSFHVYLNNTDAGDENYLFLSANPNSAGLFGGDASFEFNQNHISNTPRMANASAIDLNGDGRSDLIVKVEEHHYYCAWSYNTPPVGDIVPGESCAETYNDDNYNQYSTVRSIHKAYVSDGDLNTPHYSEHFDFGLLKAFRVADLNGDGLTDIVYQNLNNDTWFYRLSSGVGFTEQRHVGFTSTEAEAHKFYFIDLNADGRTDILRPFGNANWLIYLSKPTNNADTIIWQQRGTLAYDDDINASIKFADVNGDGSLDIISSHNANGWQVQYGQVQRSGDNVITDFDNGWGITSTITYGNMLTDNVAIQGSGYSQITDESLDSTLAPPGPMTVVKQVESDVTAANRESISYMYAGLRLHRKGLGSLGFKALKTTDNQTRIATTTTYNQHYPFIGMPETTVQKNSSYETISEANNTFDQLITAQGGILPYIDSATENQFQEGSNGTVYSLATTVTDSGYDTWGNLTRSEVKIQDDAGTVAHTTVTINQYNGSGGGAAKGRLDNTQVTKTDANGSGSITRSSSFTYHGDGMLESSTINGLTTTYGYNGFGHKILVTKSGQLNEGDTEVTSISTSSTYSSNGRFLKSTTAANDLTTTYQYNGVDADSASGKILSVTTTNGNDLQVTKYVDDWGKEIAVTSPTAPAKKTITSYCGDSCLNGGFYTVEVSQAGAPTKKVTLNRFGREVAAQVGHFDGGYSYTFKDYDSRGRLEKSYLATTNSSKSSNYSQVHYDDYSRMVSTDLAHRNEGGANDDYQAPTVTYAGFTTTKTDAQGKETTELRNVLGQLVTVTDALDGTLTYNYDSYGNLDTVFKNADGSNIKQVDNSYSSYGQKESMVDIDKGTWNYRYNDFNQLTWQQNANGDETTTVFDALGRKLRQYSYDFTQCWAYTANSASAGSRGKIQSSSYFDVGNQANCSANNFTQRKEFYYDTLGRAQHQKETINNVMTLMNGEYHTYSRFDDYGRLAQSSYPSLGLTINHAYQNGYAYKLTNADTGRVYQETTAMNASGQTTAVTYANGTSEAIGYYNASGLVSGHSVDSINSGAVHNLSYQYQASGNLAQRSHNFALTSANFDYSETYTYDDLHRLYSRTTNVGDSAYSMNESYRYDGFGNFTRKGSNKHYQYNGNKRLTGVFDNAGFSGTALYNFSDNDSYDDNGNITFDGKRRLFYASYDKVTQINQGNIQTGFSYGLGHNRIFRQDTRQEEGKSVNTYTSYISGHEKIYRTGKKDQSDLLEYKFTVGNVVITERTNAALSEDNIGNNTSTDESYLHKDHLGSPLSITDKTGVIIAQNSFDPWGKVHQLMLDDSYLSEYLVPTTRGFTGHEGVAGLDIIHMKGRIYDPTLGRFLQADPHIQAPTNSQNYNRYSYVLNNPMSYTDPSGYFFKKIGKFFKKHWRTIVAVGIAAFGGWYALTALKAGAVGAAYGYAAASGFASGFVSTGSLRGALTGAFTSMAFLGVGQATMGAHNAIKALAHGVTGGIISDLQGGKFGHGFISAGLTKGAQVAGMVSSKLIEGALQSAIIGGTISKITGGKFANGAITAAFQFAMNQYVSSKLEGSIGIKKLFGAIEAEYSSDKGFNAKLKSALKAGDVNVELDSKGQIKVMGGDGAQIGSSIDGSQHGLEGQIDVKAASFALSLKPDQNGILAVEWKVGVSGGIFSGAYGEVHHYDMSKIPIFHNFRRYNQPESLQKTGPRSICTGYPSLSSCQ